MEEIRKELEEIQKVLIEDFEPLAIILFGSYARNSQNKESDIDLAIIAKNADKKTLFFEKQKLEELALRDVDLVNLFDVNMSDGFRYEILMNGILLYCKNSFEFDLYKLNMIREFLDFNEKRQDIIERVKAGGDIYGK